MIKALATDLDGTLIPLDDSPQQKHDLLTLRKVLGKHQIELLFVTGRHADSAIAAIDEHSLPHPNWIICNVGTTILARRPDLSFVTVAAYEQELAAIAGTFLPGEIIPLLQPVGELRLQEPYKQASFKLSYYVDANQLADVVQQVESLLTQNSVPWNVIASVDPFNNDGLVDLLPEGVSKAYALQWWTRHHCIRESDIVFCGDSGNDIAALTAGFRAVVVGNAAADVVGRVQTHFAASGSLEQLHHSDHSASSGVLDGLKHFIRSSQ